MRHSEKTGIMQGIPALYNDQWIFCVIVDVECEKRSFLIRDKQLMNLVDSGENGDGTGLCGSIETKRIFPSDK